MTVADSHSWICVYVPPHTSKHFTIHDIGYFEALEMNIRKYLNLGDLSIIGDLNARCCLRNDILDEGGD